MNRVQFRSPEAQGRVLVYSPSSLVLFVAVFLLGWGFIVLAAPGTYVSAWWPAAGVSVILLLRLRRSHRLWGALGVAVVTMISNVVGGRELAVAVLFGIANASEAWLVPFILSKAGQVRPSLDNLRTAYRLCVAVTAGGLLIGLLAALTVVVVNNGEFLATWISVTAAHATAVLLIAPFALIPREQLGRVHIVEITIQIALLILVVLFIFGPGRSLPLAFLSLPVIGWAAFRLPTRVVLFELVGLAVAVSLLTSVNGGPFSQPDGLGGDPAALIQIFLLSVAGFALLATSSQNEHRTVIARLAVREAILRGGFVGSRVGLLIVERFRDGFVVLESNDMASAVIANESETIPDADGESLTVWDGELAARIQFTVRQRLDRFTWQSESDGVQADIEVLITPLRSFSTARYSIQFIDITAARRTAEAQQQALEKERVATSRLTELSRQKEEFVASASHELRTPITSIIGYVELLEEEELDDFQRSSVETIARNARRLADLVESLLELGRPRDPSAPVAPTDIVHVATEVAHSLEPFAERSGITLTLPPNDHILAAVPAIDLDRILTNLLNNAIKFTPPGGSVALGLSATDSDAVLTITDTGPGMTEEVIGHIFERFYRAPDAETRGITGTGLGLPLVQGLALKHFGTVTVASTIGKGSTFTVTLPLGASSEAG